MPKTSKQCQNSQRSGGEQPTGNLEGLFCHFKVNQSIDRVSKNRLDITGIRENKPQRLQHSIKSIDIGLAHGPQVLSQIGTIARQNRGTAAQGLPARFSNGSGLQGQKLPALDKLDP